MHTQSITNLEPAFRRDISDDSHTPFGKAEELAAFVRLTDLRFATWTAILAEPKRARLAIASLTEEDTKDGTEDPALTTWLAARDLYLGRSCPSKREQATMDAASADLIAYIRTVDKDDLHLLAACKRVASYALPGMPHAASAVVTTWTRAVASALTAYQAAVHEVEERNIRLVVNLAKTGSRWHDAQIFTVDDLVGYGYSGLHTAALRFDHARGFRFSTYATYWIRHAITRAVQDGGRLIRVPVHVLDQLGKIRRTAHSLGKGATAAAIAEKVGISAKRIETMRRESMTTYARPASLDAPLPTSKNADGVPTTLADILADDAEPADDTIARTDAVARLGGLLAALTPKERDIIERRACLGADAGDAPPTLDEVGEEYGLSRERIRLIQVAAMRKMRRAAEASGMVSAMG